MERELLAAHRGRGGALTPRAGRAARRGASDVARRGGDFGSDGAAGGCNAPLKTITHAAAVASAGETIKVLSVSHSYNDAAGEVFPIHVPAGVTILGAASRPGIQARSLTDENYVIDLGAGAALRSFNLSLPANMSGSQDGVHLAADGATVESCTLSNFAAALSLDAVATNALIRGNTILGNNVGLTFNGSPSRGRLERNYIGSNGTGVYIYKTSTASGSVGLADLGGGPLGSEGGNELSCNRLNDLYVLQATARSPYHGPIVVYARNNKWDHTPPSTAYNLDLSCEDGNIDTCLQFSDQSVEDSGWLLSATPCP